ncbi:MAG TPA: polyphosphate kinase 2 family protein [Pyrinomonadaceae bacterium]|nr:polyphosphate kinase 2 family protein [Pyrinomonadaceae bacterium]
MNYLEKFIVKPGQKIQLKDIDPDFCEKNHDKKSGKREADKLEARIEELQGQLYAEGKQSLLICLQALDAGGKDGVVRHVFDALNPQSCRVVSFKQPSSEELAHDFLWRIEHQTPRRGEVVIFNRSHYEDVLVVRVHNIVPKEVWTRRYEQINDFEERLAANNTHILKFFLHISKEEQLERFKQRLEDPAKRWKIAESDYSERNYWNDYQAAFEDVFSQCSTKHAPWFVIPANHKWFRDLAISHIIVDTLESLGMKLPLPTVDIASIQKKYHEAAAAGRKTKK